MSPVVQTPPQPNSEYDDIYKSIMHLKHGNLGPFAELMSRGHLVNESKPDTSSALGLALGGA